LHFRLFLERNNPVLAFAMQKVVGSSPIIRFQNPRKSGVLLFEVIDHEAFFLPISTFCAHLEGQTEIRAASWRGQRP
jgi:hypothetical protein